MDDWANQRYGDYYGVSDRNATRQQSTADRNQDRTWGAMDQNTGLTNNAVLQNSIDNPQQRFNNAAAVTGGVANAYNGVANTYGQNAQGAAQWGQQWIDRGTQAASNVAKAGG